MSRLPYVKILDLSKFEAFADNKVNVTQKLKFVLERIENIVKRSKCWFYLRVIKQSDCLVQS